MTRETIRSLIRPYLSILMPTTICVTQAAVLLFGARMSREQLDWLETSQESLVWLSAVILFFWFAERSVNYTGFLDKLGGIIGTLRTKV